MTNRHADLNDNEKKLVEAAMAIEVSIAGYCGLGPNFNRDKRLLSEALTPYRPVEQITIAGITFDAPLREEPVRDADIFIPSMFHPTGYHCDTWSGYSHQQAGLKAGGCFATPEAAAACARAYAKLVGGEV